MYLKSVFHIYKCNYIINVSVNVQMDNYFKGEKITI